VHYRSSANQIGVPLDLTAPPRQVTLRLAGWRILCKLRNSIGELDPRLGGTAPYADLRFHPRQRASLEPIQGRRCLDLRHDRRPASCAEATMDRKATCSGVLVGSRCFSRVLQGSFRNANVDRERRARLALAMGAVADRGHHRRMLFRVADRPTETTAFDLAHFSLQPVPQPFPVRFDTQRDDALSTVGCRTIWLTWRAFNTSPERPGTAMGSSSHETTSPSSRRFN